MLERRLLGCELPLSAEEAGAHLDVTEARGQATTGRKARVTPHLFIGEMFQAYRSTSSSGSFQSVSGGSNVTYVRVVETDAYADWESSYRDSIGRLYRVMDAGAGNRPDTEDLTSDVFRTALGPLRLPHPRARFVHISSVRPRRFSPHTGAAAWDSPSPRSSRSRAPSPWSSRQVPSHSATLLCGRRSYWPTSPIVTGPSSNSAFWSRNTIKEAARTMDISVSNAKVLRRRAFPLAAKVSVEFER